MRNVISLNKNWAFIQENAGLPGEMPTDWHKVDLPHTWNAVDGHDGNGSYDRGIRCLGCVSYFPIFQQMQIIRQHPKTQHFILP